MTFKTFFGNLSGDIASVIRYLRHILWLRSNTMENKIIFSDEVRDDLPFVAVMRIDYSQKHGEYVALCEHTSSGKILSITMDGTRIATEGESLQTNMVLDRRRAANHKAAAELREQHKEHIAKLQEEIYGTDTTP